MVVGTGETQFVYYIHYVIWKRKGACACVDGIIVYFIHYVKGHQQSVLAQSSRVPFLQSTIVPFERDAKWTNY